MKKIKKLGKSVTASSRARVHQAVKKAVVPHKKNQYRPHLIRGHGIAIVVALALFSQAGYNLIQTGTVLGAKSDVTRQELLKDTNAQRERRGEPTLQLDESLNAAATLKAKDMLAQQYWAHEAPNGKTPWSWFKKVQYEYLYAGENLAKGFTSSNGVVTAWMNSPEHRENLLDSRYRDVGFAAVPGMLNGEETMLVVALYGTQKQKASLAATSENSNYTVLAAADGSTSLITRIGIGIQSMTPALLGSIVLLLFASGVAIVSHVYRKKLPKPLRQSWYRHHGLYKAIGMSSLVVVLIALYGGGQI